MLQLSVVNFKKGAYVVIEGTNDADKFFIIQQGQVRCTLNNQHPGYKQTTLGPGDFVGVVPCMAGRHQIESAIALTDVSCISVRKDQYQELIKTNTPVAIKIIRTFASKVRSLNDTLSQVTANNTAASSDEQLFTTAAYYETKGQLNLAVYGYYQYLKASPKGMYAAVAQKRFVALKPMAKSVCFEPSADLLRTYPKGTMVFSDSQKGADMFVIKDGKVRISKVVNGKEVIFAILNKGDMFGEMALLENKPRSASAIAEENCTLMTINRRNFDQMVATQPQLIDSLTTMLAERIWTMYRQLSNSAMTNPVDRMIDMLSLQVEKNRAVAYSHTPLQTDLQPYNLAVMCGIDVRMQPDLLEKFIRFAHVKFEQARILVPDCMELVKQAEYLRKPKRGVTIV